MAGWEVELADETSDAPARPVAELRGDNFIARVKDTDQGEAVVIEFDNGITLAVNTTPSSDQAVAMTGFGLAAEYGNPKLNAGDVSDKELGESTFYIELQRKRVSRKV